MATEEREKKRRITDPVLVDLCDIFEDGHAPDAIAILTFMKLKNVEDIYITYPGLLATMASNEAQFKKLGEDMKAAGARIQRQSSGTAPTRTWVSRPPTRVNSCAYAAGPSKRARLARHTTMPRRWRRRTSASAESSA